MFFQNRFVPYTPRTQDSLNIRFVKYTHRENPERMFMPLSTLSGRPSMVGHWWSIINGHGHGVGHSYILVAQFADAFLLVHAFIRFWYTVFFVHLFMHIFFHSHLCVQNLSWGKSIVDHMTFEKWMTFWCMASNHRVHSLSWTWYWFSKNWFSKNWFSKNWFAKHWFSKNWFAKNWFPKNWFSKNLFSKNWLSKYWFSKNWFSKKTGFPKTGFPKTGSPNAGFPKTVGQRFFSHQRRHSKKQWDNS